MNPFIYTPKIIFLLSNTSLEIGELRRAAVTYAHDIFHLEQTFQPLEQSITYRVGGSPDHRAVTPSFFTICAAAS